MITHVLMISHTFQKSHPRAGEPTNFREKVLDGTKGHTIRLNPKYWAKKLDQVIKGDAVLELREWKGGPYKSNHRTIQQLYNHSGVGYQFCTINARGRSISVTGGGKITRVKGVEERDGLSVEDFWNWFKKDEVGIIIHFGKFRY